MQGFFDFLRRARGGSGRNEAMVYTPRKGIIQGDIGIMEKKMEATV